MAEENNLVEKRVQHGIDNVAYAKLSFDENGNPVYGKITRLNGITDVHVDGESKPEPIFADNKKYSKGIISNASQVEGKLTVLHVGESFGRDALGMLIDNRGLLVTIPNSGSSFALMYEKTVDMYDGTQDTFYQLYYNVDAYEPDKDATTDKADKNDATTFEIKLDVNKLKVIEDMPAINGFSTYLSKLSNEDKDKLYSEVLIPNFNTPSQ